MIRATASRVRIYSMNSELLADWPRAERPGEYMTNPEHMPAWYRDMEGTSVTSLVSEASQIGPHTSKFIRQLLEDCAVPVQGFRRCQAILRFARRYGNEVLEKACADALCAGKVNYIFLRNTVAAVAEQSGDGAKHDAYGTANEDVYKADPGKTSLDKLLARSAQLISAAQKGRETHEE